MNDQKIIEQFFRRNEQALIETDKAYGQYCRSIAMRILQNDADAQECVNDAYLQMWRSIPPHKPQRLKPYLGKITRNLSLHLLEKRNAQKRGAGEISLLLDELAECIPEGNTYTVEDQVAFSDLINRFLASLPTQARQMFIGRYWYGYTVRELAASQHISSDNVAAVLYRTRKKLAAYLSEKGVTI